MVVNELRGEKIDIVPFSEDLPDFVAKALSPAKVSQVNISDDGTQADVIVPDHQLSLAIGREGQNARLAARLTGVRVDIRSETQVAEGVPAGGIVDDVEYAEGEWVTNAETGDMEWHAADGSVISQAEWQAQSESETEPDVASAEPEVASDAASEAAPSGDDTEAAVDVAGATAEPAAEAAVDAVADDDTELSDEPAVEAGADDDSESAAATEDPGTEDAGTEDAATKGAGDDD
jgi:N utilization substance protein A